MNDDSRVSEYEWQVSGGMRDDRGAVWEMSGQWVSGQFGWVNGAVESECEWVSGGLTVNGAVESEVSEWVVV